MTDVGARSAPVVRTHAAGDGAAGGACRRDEARARPTLSDIPTGTPWGACWLNDDIAGGAQADEESTSGCQAAGGAAGKDGASRCGGPHRCAPSPLAPFLAPLLPAPAPRAEPYSLVRVQVDLRHVDVERDDEALIDEEAAESDDDEQLSLTPMEEME